MKKILVTWWAWFIGSHLCRKLLLKWHEVICLDNLFWSDRSNIYDLLGNPKFSFVLHDITQPFFIQVDEIYNLACPNYPQHKQRNPVETIKTSVMWSVNMLELATRVKAKVLQASTSRIYGEGVSMPKEDYPWSVDTIDVNNSYSEGKRAAETIFMSYHKEYGVDIKIARIFKTYWPNMKAMDGKLISYMIIKALKSENIVLYWDVNKKLWIQYVDDLIESLILLMKVNNWFIWPINLWSPTEITIKQIAERILSLLPQSRSKIVFKDKSDDKTYYNEPPKILLADITLAKQILNREPVMKLDDWLKKTIDYFRAQDL